MTEKRDWPTVPFGDVVRLNTDRVADPAAAGIERYVGIEHITPGDLRIRSWGLVAGGTTFTNHFRPGQALFAKRRAYQRKVAVADFEGVCSGDIYVLESKDPDVLLPELLPLICQTDGFFHHAIDTSAGSLSPRTNWSQLAAYEFLLPPPAEQRRLVEHLTKTEALVESIIWAMESLRRVRYSVEKKTFMGTEDSNNSAFGELVRRGTLSFQTGPFGTVLKASSYKDSGHPVVNPSDMLDGKILLDNCRFIDELDWKRLEKYQVRTDDMFIGRKGDMQNLVFVSPEHSGYLLGSDCIRFRVHDNSLLPKYLFYYLRAETTRQWLQAQAYGTIMPGINEKLLAKMTIILPSVDQQLDAIEEIHRVDEAHSLLEERLKSVRKLKLAGLADLNRSSRSNGELVL